MTLQISSFTSDHAEFLSDESKRIGKADEIAFPVTESEVIEAVRSAYERRLPVITQGARTGIVAGAVPNGGLVINLRSMNKIEFPVGKRISHCVRNDEVNTVVVQPGALLSDLRAIIDPAGLLFRP